MLDLQLLLLIREAALNLYVVLVVCSMMTATKEASYLSLSKEIIVVNNMLCEEKEQKSGTA